MADIIDQNGNPLPQPSQPLMPQFPMTNINMHPDGSGMKITLVLASGVELSTTLGPDIMHQITKAWREIQKSMQDQMRVIEHVKSTKLN